MAQPATITSVDIGTSNITSILAMYDPTLSQYKILGHMTVPSRGVKKGIVVDIDQVTACIEDCLEKAERMAGVAATNVIVSVGGPHIASLNSHGIVAIADPKGDISSDDIERVIEAAKAVSLPSNRQVLLVSPKQYTVDGQAEIRSPIGMNGVRLEVDCHIITASSTNLRNLDRVLETVDVQNDAFVFSAVASADCVLTDSEKDLGVCIVDVGAGKIDMCVYIEGALHHTLSVPIGAKHITSDLAIGLRLPLEVAEELKIYLSKHYIPSDGRKALELPDISSFLAQGEASDYTAKSVYENIITARLEEIVEFVQSELEKTHLLKSLPAGVVFVGGGANTIGLLDVAKQVLRMPVRIGKINMKLTGLSGDLMDPKYACALGLLSHNSEQSQRLSARGRGDVRSISKLMSGSGSVQMGSILKKVKSFFHQFLP
ncbi:MAG: cell division protein FtsA [Candidatus Roizmanbacteria bacterium]